MDSKLDWRAIPKFTDDARYRVYTDLKYLRDAIDCYIKDYNLNMNPDFQRGHVWTQEQQSAYVEFLIRGGAGASEIRFNYPNWQKGYSETDEMVVVDGLQRLTACLKFVDSKLPVFDGYYLDDIENVNPMLRGINLIFMVNGLRTRKEVLQWYLELNSGGTPHSNEELDRVRGMLKDL